LCETTLAPTSATPLTPPADLPVLGWWGIVLTKGTCPWSAPDLAYLGFGALDERLRRAMGAHDIDPTTSSMYGAYVQQPVEDAPVFVYAVAGTPANLEGTEVAVTVPPLPDGPYVLQGLYLLPFWVE
jgi:hypothetical protein